VKLDISDRKRLLRTSVCLKRRFWSELAAQKQIASYQSDREELSWCEIVIREVSELLPFGRVQRIKSLEIPHTEL
jgi:hypothetical protein